MMRVGIGIVTLSAAILLAVCAAEAAEKGKPFIGRDDGRVQQSAGSKNVKAKVQKAPLNKGGGVSGLKMEQDVMDERSKKLKAKGSTKQGESPIRTFNLKDTFPQK